MADNNIGEMAGVVTGFSLPRTGGLLSGISGSLDLYRRIRDDHPRNRGDKHAKL